jgi:hypothetical protein
MGVWRELAEARRIIRDMAIKTVDFFLGRSCISLNSHIG